MVLVCGGCAVFSMAVGVFFFKRNQDRFVLYMYDRISSAIRMSGLVMVAMAKAMRATMPLE